MIGVLQREREKERRESYFNFLNRYRFKKTHKEELRTLKNRKFMAHQFLRKYILDILFLFQKVIFQKLEIFDDYFVLVFLQIHALSLDTLIIEQYITITKILQKCQQIFVINSPIIYVKFKNYMHIGIIYINHS